MRFRSCLSAEFDSKIAHNHSILDGYIGYKETIKSRASLSYFAFEMPILPSQIGSSHCLAGLRLFAVQNRPTVGEQSVWYLQSVWQTKKCIPQWHSQIGAPSFSSPVNSSDWRTKFADYTGELVQMVMLIGIRGECTAGPASFDWRPQTGHKHQQQQ